MNDSRREYLPVSEDVATTPAHDITAEMGVLGCVLLSPNECVPEVQQRFGTDEVFYDLRHQAIWNALTYLHSQSNPIDVIILQNELRSRGLLEQIGGLAYLASLPDSVPSAANLPSYLDIVWEKYVARSLVEKNTAEIEVVRKLRGATESFVVQVDERHQRWKKLLERGTITPKNLCEPKQFAEAYYDAWFERKDDTYGWPLPFNFPLRLRPSEMTLFTGDNGSGKSSMLGLMNIFAAREFQKDERAVIASMEVPPEITLWIMARQLLGVGKLERTEANIAKIVKALAWLQKRILLYNFLGITDWRELLNTFRYAQQHRNAVLFTVDSVMRIGIPDDDYATQGVAAAAFADFSVQTGAHTFLVVHENKGEGRAKDKIRGSKQWSDNAHNVVGMKRNEDKAAKLKELEAERDAGEMSDQDYAEAVEKYRKVWDAKFILNKQRWPGSQQNASRWLYFHHDSLQFHEEPGKGSFDFTLK